MSRTGRYTFATAIKAVVTATKELGVTTPAERADIMVRAAAAVAHGCMDRTDFMAAVDRAWADHLVWCQHETEHPCR